MRRQLARRRLIQGWLVRQGRLVRRQQVRQGWLVRLQLAHALLAQGRRTIQCAQLVVLALAQWTEESCIGLISPLC